MDNNSKLIIVLGRNYSNALAVIRSLGSAGYTVDFIASSHKPRANDVARKSKYVRNFVEIVSRKVRDDEGDPALIAEIMKYTEEPEDTEEALLLDGKPILFPTDDYTTSVIDGSRDLLSEHFLMPYIKGGKEGDLAALMNKTVQCRMAEDAGLLVPVTKTVSLRDSQIIIPSDVPYPCFVKPIRSIEGYKTEMMVCNNEEELQEHLKTMQRRFADRDVIIQEYLEIEQEYASAGICLDQEVILPALIRKTKIGKHGRGVTLTGELVSPDVIGEENLRKAIDLLKSFHYTGNFGMEFNAVGDKIYFNEVNLRSAGESYAYFKYGVNLPVMFVRNVLGEENEPAEGEFAGIGKTMLYDKIAWDDYIYGSLTEEELDECYEVADVKILEDEDDPEPGELFLMHGKRTRKKRMRRREPCVEATIEATEWEKEYAERKIDAARERTGIKYWEYKWFRFWEVPEEEQVSRYEEILKERENVLVVVLTRSYATGLAVIRSLGHAGVSVDLVGNARRRREMKIPAGSSYIRRYTEVVSKKVNSGGDRAILRELLEYEDEAKVRKIVLFPTDDYTMAVVDSNRDLLEKLFIMPNVINGVEGTMVGLMDKAVQAGLARKAGLDLPAEWVISLRDELEIPDDMIYPCFCKPKESIGGYKAEMAKCDTREELEEHLTALRDRRPNREILVQEFLDIDTEIDINGVCNDQEVIIPAIIRKTHIAQHKKGITLAGVVEPLDKLGDTAAAVERLMKEFCYTGMFDLELNIVGDKIYFNEVNLRSGGPNFAYFMSGVNLPYLAVKALLGLPHDPSEERVTEYGKSFINESVAYDDYAARCMSKRELKKMLDNSDIRLMEYEEDPGSTAIFYETIADRAVAKRKRKNAAARKNAIRPYLTSFVRRLQGYPQGKRSNRRDPNSELPRILVAGRNWCTNLCFARSLGEAGYEVEVLRIFQKAPNDKNLLKWLKPEMRSKYVKAYYVCNSKRRSRRIVARLQELADPDRKMLLIPADDLVAYIIDDHYDELKDYYLMPNINGTGGGIVELMHKDVQKELAREAGLPLLDSCVIRSSDGAIRIPDSVTYPCFIKPNISRFSSKSRMMKCDTEEELLDALRAREGVGFQMLVEEYAEIKREFSYLGLSTPEGVICPGYFEAVEEGEGAHRGVALLGRMLPTKDAEPLISEVSEFIKSLGFTGLFDVDLIETTDGKSYFVEINMRYGASGQALTECGINLPAMFADYMLKGKPLDKRYSINTKTKTFASEKVLIDEYKEGILEYEDIDRIMETAEVHFVKNENDMKPYKHLVKHYKTAKRLRDLKLAEDEDEA